MPFPNKSGRGSGTGGVINPFDANQNGFDGSSIANLNVWGAANLNFLYTPDSTGTTFNRTIATVGNDVYYWTGDPNPDTYPVGGAWTLLTDTLNGPEIVTLINGTPNDRTVTLAEKTRASELQSAESRRLLLKNVSGQIEEAPVMHDPTNETPLMFLEETNFGANSITLASQVLSNSFGFLSNTNKVNNEEYQVLDQRSPTDAASDKPRRLSYTGAESNLDIYTENTTDISLPHTFRITSSELGRTNVIMFTLATAATNVRFQIRNISPDIANEPIREWPNQGAWLTGQGGTNFSAGTMMINLGTAKLPLAPNRVIEIEVRADSGTLRGNATGEPVLSVLRQQGEFKTIADVDDIVEAFTNGSYLNTRINSRLENNLPVVDLGFEVQTYSGTTTYFRGSITQSNYQGHQAFFISTADQLPDATLPETKLETGQWQLLTDRIWRGAWAAGNYLAGQVTTQSGGLWMNVVPTGPTDTNPPSETNTSWRRIDGGGAGDGSSLYPTIYRRSSTTMDAAFLSSRVDFDGSSGDATFTAPTTAATGFANGSTTYIENTSASSTVTLAAASGLTISGDTSIASGRLYLLIWEDVEGGNDILHVYWLNNSSTGATGTGPYNGYRTKTASATLLSTETGTTAYTGTADAIFTLPSGLGASDTWLGFIDNRSSAGMLTISGAISTDVLESGQGSVYYWDGTAFGRGALKSRSNVATFPDNSNNPIQASTTYTGNGGSYTTGANGITYGNSQARLVFLNTNLRMQTSVVYAHDLPELSLVEESEGFTITKTSTSSDQLVRPFSGSTIVFGSTTFTFQNPLRLTSGSVTVVKSTSTQWLVTSLTGTFIGGSTSGGSGSSQSDLTSGVFYNETGSAVEIGDGVHLDGLDGNQSFSSTNLGADGLLAGFAQEDIPANASGQIGRDGPVNIPKIRITNGINIGAPLADGARLFWYAGGVGLTSGYITLDEDDGANQQVMRIITSNWKYSTQEFTSNVIINTQAGWDTEYSKVHVKNAQTNLDFQIPDLAEGSAEVTAVAGQQIIIHIPLGGGTASVRPRGASTIAPKSGSGTTYTNAAPFAMTGGATAEYWVVEVNTAANGYVYYPLNTNGINNLGFFNAADYYNRLQAQAVYNNSVNITSNTQAIDIFKRNLVVPNLVDAIANPSGQAIANIDQGLEYETSGGSTNLDRGWTISTTASEWTGLQSNMSVIIRFYNSKSSTTAFIDAETGNFFGTNSGRITLNAESDTLIRVKNTGSATLELREVS